MNRPTRRARSVSDGNPPVGHVSNVPSTGELRTELESILARHFGRPCAIDKIERRPSSQRSSFALEELDVLLDDGVTLPILFKDLSPTAVLPGAREVRVDEAKPPFLFNPRREIETYRLILANCPGGAAICFGATVDRDRERYWLFLEKVSGRELYQVGEIGLWQEAARWLAGFHHHFSTHHFTTHHFTTHHSPLTTHQDVQALAKNACLTNYDRDYYHLWMARALAFADGGNSSRARLNWLAERYDRVVERLTALPATIIHGEFYASNILVQETCGASFQLAGSGKVRVCPVDWEMAALGPGLIDLAALTAGGWRDQDKKTIAQAYFDALPRVSAPLWGEDWPTTLDYCHLHLAVQWLGWSPRWTPPPEHAQDWLSQALRLAETLGL